MEAMFKQYFWVAKAVGFGCVAAFAGSAAADLVGVGVILDADAAEARIELFPKPEEAEEISDPTAHLGAAFESTGADDRGTSKAKLAVHIVEHNVFCPTCRPPSPELAEAIAGPAHGDALRKSTLPLTLVATMVAEDPEFSRATIADGSAESLGLFVVADAVRPGLTLDSVDRDYAVLRSASGLEYISLGEDAPVQAAHTLQVKGPTERPKRKNKHAIEGADEAIKCASETSCTIDREFVDKILNMPEAMEKQARVVPSMRDGETRGFKFYGVRSGSIPKLLGLNNGDLITNVNGTELTSLDEVMGLYTKLRRASNLSVTIERKGETIQKDIEIK